VSSSNRSHQIAGEGKEDAFVFASVRVLPQSQTLSRCGSSRPDFVQACCELSCPIGRARAFKYQLIIPSCVSPRTSTPPQSEGMLINETLVRDLASGDSIARERNGGAGSTDRHRKDRSCHRHRHKLHPSGARGRFYNVVKSPPPPSARGIDSKDLTVRAM
jgi:hypothetical protein